MTLKETKVLRVWNLLSLRDRKKIKLIAGVQILSGLLDLIGVLLIGIIAALAVSGFGTNQTGTKILGFLRLVHLESASVQIQIGILGCIATLVLVVKTGFSVYFTRRMLNYLSHQGAQLSAKAIRQTFNLSVLQLQARTQQEILFSVTTGPTLIMVGILGTSVAMVADASLVIVLGVALISIDPLVASFSMVFFLGIGLLLYRILHKRATFLGKKATMLNLDSLTKISEVLLSYRFHSVRGTKDYFSNQIGGIRVELGGVYGENAFMPYISKYVVETALVTGSLMLAASQFLLQDATHAVATLSIFMAAGSRIAPAALRMQQGGIAIKNNLGVCEPVLSYLEDLTSSESFEKYFSDKNPRFDHLEFIPKVSLKNVHFQYPDSLKPALSEISFEITQGSITSIVGASGSGKSTLADVILGVLSPSEGKVEVSGKPVLEALKNWPGATAYVPQEVALINGTIRENVAVGFDPDAVSDTQILKALKLAQLEELVLSQPNGIRTFIGERGTRLSGGQRQRLGIARALFTNPKLIVLDEATSSLDSATEADISGAIHNLRGIVTVVMIAHRLSTVKESDQLIYLSEGRIVCQGTFEQVRKAVPDFEKQALLMGL
jgi:ABC-type multidrug transport system fused ATPase/permease subunit